jgi:hypothetical protein
MQESDHKLYIVTLNVGEREEDSTAMFEIRQEVYRQKVYHDPSRVEMYSASVLEKDHCQYYMAWFLAERVQRIAELGYDVVQFVDSASRVAVAHSMAVEIDKGQSGMIGKGMKTVSLTEVRKLFSIGGQFGEGSLTQISTMLGGSDDPSLETAFFPETGVSSSTAIWALGLFQNSNRPWIDLKRTHTREWIRFAPAYLCHDRDTVLAMMLGEGQQKRGGVNAPPPMEIQLQKLLEFASKHPERT